MRSPIRWLRPILMNIPILLFLLTSTLSSQETEYRSVAPKKGERCIICGVPLTADDVVLIVRGRRVPLNQAMVDSFQRNQEKYFAKLQPRGALFQENLQAPAGVAQGGITLGWFLFGLYVLVALVFSGFSGYVAVAKGLSPIPYFFIGFFFSAFGFIYVLTRPAAENRGDIPKGLVKVPATKPPVVCPECGDTNHPSAAACLGCGGKLEPAYESETTRAS